MSLLLTFLFYPAMLALTGHHDLSVLTVIIQLVWLEGSLSVDNAAALAALANKLPEEAQAPWPFKSHFWGEARQAVLKVGIFFAYFFRFSMIFVATWLMQYPQFRDLGAIYLLWLVARHFLPRQTSALIRTLTFGKLGKEDHEDKTYQEVGKLTIRLFLVTMIQVEILDLSLSYDNVIAAVALSKERWAIYLGVGIGMLAMRFAATYFQKWMEKRPELEHAAFALLAPIAIELLAEQHLHIETPHLVKFGISMGILLGTLALGEYFRRKEEGEAESEGVWVTVNQQGRIADGRIQPETGFYLFQIDPVKNGHRVNAAVAFDTSLSMGPHFHKHFWEKRSEVDEFLHRIGTTVSQYDSDQHVQVILGCLGEEGRDTYDVGSFDADGLNRYHFDLHDMGLNVGGGTYLLPTIQAAQQKLLSQENVDYAAIVVVTDGRPRDFDELREWAFESAEKMVAGEMPMTKVIFVGVHGANDEILRTLDNLPTEGVDVFDYVSWKEIMGRRGDPVTLFKEQLQRSAVIVAREGRILVDGAIHEEFPHGVPQTLEGRLPIGAKNVILELDGVSQKLKLAAA